MVQNVYTKKNRKGTPAPIFTRISPNHVQDKANVMFEKSTLNSRKINHRTNAHLLRVEPITQSSLSRYTSKSDGFFGRKQHFQFGQVIDGSCTNSLIYGHGNVVLDLSGIKPKEKIHVQKQCENSNNSFIYGKNDSSRFKGNKKTSNTFSLEERSSGELHKKLKEMKETEEEYRRFRKQKEEALKIRNEEKKKDLHVLKTYKQPWGKPGGGAPRGETHQRSNAVHELVNQEEQVLSLGRPGGGAPLRTDSGSLKASLAADPEIRFQKRDRHQIHGIIMPDNNRLNRQNPLVTDLDILAQDSRGKRNVMKRSQDTSMPVYDPFGRPGAGAPIRDENGNSKTTRSMNLIKTVQETGDGVGRGGAGAPHLDNNGNVITSRKQTLKTTDDAIFCKSIDNMDDNGYNPWGRCGAGAPIRDQNGNLVTMVTGKYAHDNYTYPKRDTEVRKQHLEWLRHQVEEQEQMKKREVANRKLNTEDACPWLHRNVSNNKPTKESFAETHITSNFAKPHVRTVDNLWVNTDSKKQTQKVESVEVLTKNNKRNAAVFFEDKSSPQGSDAEGQDGLTTKRVRIAQSVDLPQRRCRPGNAGYKITTTQPQKNKLKVT